MGLSRSVSEGNGGFGRKLQKKFPPRVYRAPAEGVSVGFFNGGEAQKTRMMPLLDVKKYDDMSVHFDTYWSLHGQTDTLAKLISDAINTFFQDQDQDFNLKTKTKIFL